MQIHEINTKSLPPVIKSESDWRNFRALQLPNKVTCVLVNDKESKKTACSVCVGAGASSDPRSLSGLAHFTEHMCFLGSKAYPLENEFKSYLSSKGGRSNASTAMFATTYKFDILAQHAEKCVDIFSNFFIDPLFTESGTSREVNAVDSENSKNESNDGRRRLQILKSLGDQNHHFTKFSTGNAKTLPATQEGKAGFIRECLLAFHKIHYTPDNFCVVIVGPQDLDTLEKWIVPRFAKMRKRWVDKPTADLSVAEKLVIESAKDAPVDSFYKHEEEMVNEQNRFSAVPYNPTFKSEIQGGQWPVLLTTRPLQSVRKLFIYFPLPPTRKYGDKSPYPLLTHLLGHEGKGSCFAVLQDAEMIDSISAGPRLSDIDQSLLQISISLTEKGERNWADVVDTVFKYIEILRTAALSAKKMEEVDVMKQKESGVNDIKRIWADIVKLRQIDFDFSSPGQAFSFAPALARSVRVNGTEKCLSAGSLLNEDEDSLPLDVLEDFLENMTVNNCFIERCSQTAWKEMKKKEPNDSLSPTLSEMFGFKREKWYNVEYHLSQIESPIKNLWNITNVQSKKRIVESKPNICLENLHLPQKNQYIPHDLSLCPDLPRDALEGPRISKELDPPNLITQNAFGRLWHRLDDRYCLPKSSISFLLRNPIVNHHWDEKGRQWSYDEKSSLHSKLLLRVFADVMAQEIYDAGIAGLHWSISTSSMGMLFKFSGYSENISRFALRILGQFFCDGGEVSSGFLKEQYLKSNQERMIRNLSSFLKSNRADVYASYYTDLLLASRGHGIDHTLSIANGITFDSLVGYYNKLVTENLEVECLYSGNVSEIEAKSFFTEAENLVPIFRNKENEIKDHPIPVPYLRKLLKGDDVSLHFQSENEEERNGAVKMTFQSSIPSFRGKNFSNSKMLLQSASLRCICHMLKEPLFNQLRTKEQLGYIVNSYFDIKYSSNGSDLDEHSNTVYQDTSVVPIDNVVINVLSKKVPPPVLTKRIDEFLESFRDTLSNMPKEQINSHKDALSQKLLQPKTDLRAEVGLHFGKISNYAPEVYKKQLGFENMPWDTSKQLSSRIKTLNRADLLKTWDNVLGSNRSRVVSHVYGSSFPITTKRLARFNRKAVLKSMEDIKLKRESLAQYNNVTKTSMMSKISIDSILKNKNVVALSIVGVGFVLYSIGGGWGSRSSNQNKK